MDSIWFSDEAHFTLKGQVNKQNMRYWSSDKPDFYQETPLRSDRVTAWVALSSDGLIGPYLYEVGGATATVTSERYLSLIKSKFLPSLRTKALDKDEIYFQQDGAAPHTSYMVKEWLDDTLWAIDIAVNRTGMASTYTSTLTVVWK